jgi:hypothetical protein
MLNDTFCDDVAVYSLMGIDTRPKEIVPEPIERAAMEKRYQPSLALVES